MAIFRTLKNAIENSDNELVKASYKTMFLPEWNGFNEPYSYQATVNVGTELFNNSIYNSYGIQTNMNGCPTIRKGLLRLKHIVEDKVTNLGYIYKNADGSVTVGYCDENKATVNDYLAKGKAPNDARMIHLHMMNNVIVEACVTEKGSSTQLVIGKNEHTIACYYFGLMSYLYVNDDVWKKRLEHVMNSIVNSEPEEAAAEMTVIENDLIIESISMEDSASATGVGIVFNDDIYEEAKQDGTVVFDSMEDTKKKRKSSNSASNTTTMQTIEEITKSRKYDLGYKPRSEFVPTIYDNDIATEELLEMADMILFNHNRGIASNFLSIGEAGTGKSVDIQKLCRILNIEYHRVTCSSSTEAYDLLSNIIPDGREFKTVDSELVIGIQCPSIVEIQEINALKRASTATILNSLMDDSNEVTLLDGRIIHRHPDSIIIGTMNDGYEGMTKLNQAVLSRTNYKIMYKFPEKTQLKERLSKRTSLDADTIKKMVDCIVDIRKVLENNGETLGVCGQRELFAWGQCTEAFGDAYKAATRTIIPSATFDLDLQAELENVVGKYFFNA